MNFADRLAAAIESKRSHVVVGLDPDYASLPAELRGEAGPQPDAAGMAAAYRQFLEDLLRELSEVAVAVKIQLAFFEALGAAGYQLYLDLVARAHDLGYLVIADAKRGDIGNTSEAYARAHLDVAGADAMTVNAYFGTDGMEPFLRRAREEGKGLFVLVKTSNPGSRELQDLVLVDGRPVYRAMASLVEGWGAAARGQSGLSAVGAVVGGTHPAQARELRSALPSTPFLIPGYGSQGATAQDMAGLFGPEGVSAVVNSARAILYAYKKRPLAWREAARREAEEMRDALWRVARPADLG